MADDEAPDAPPPPRYSFDPVNIAGRRNTSDWANMADASNEFVGPAGLLALAAAKIASLFRRKPPRSS